MSNLNKSWIILIVIGVILMMITIGWDIYQIFSGNNDEFNYTVNPIPIETLCQITLESI